MLVCMPRLGWPGASVHLVPWIYIECILVGNL